MTELITSLQNPKVKLAHSLQTRARSRRKEGKIVLEGSRLVGDAFTNGVVPEFVLYTETSDLVETLIEQNVITLPVDRTVMQHVADTESPQGILGVFPKPEPTLPPDANRILILDAITDPGNMGTMIRTAAGAGIDAVILADGCVDLYNPKVLRSGMGAHFRVPVLEMNWEQIQLKVRTANIYIADADANTSYDCVNWQDSWALIIGSEAHGIGNEARTFATTSIHIPMANETESLNAAIAAGIILFEAARQRH